MPGTAASSNTQRTLTHAPSSYEQRLLFCLVRLTSKPPGTTAEYQKLNRGFCLQVVFCMRFQFSCLRKLTLLMVLCPELLIRKTLFVKRKKKYLNKGKSTSGFRSECRLKEYSLVLGLQTALVAELAKQQRK